VSTKSAGRAVGVDDQVGAGRQVPEDPRCPSGALPRPRWRPRSRSPRPASAPAVLLRGKGTPNSSSPQHHRVGDVVSVVSAGRSRSPSSDLTRPSRAPRSPRSRSPADRLWDLEVDREDYSASEPGHASGFLAGERAAFCRESARSAASCNGESVATGQRSDPEARCNRSGRRASHSRSPRRLATPQSSHALFDRAVVSERNLRAARNSVSTYAEASSVSRGRIDRRGDPLRDAVAGRGGPSSSLTPLKPLGRRGERQAGCNEHSWRPRWPTAPHTRRFSKPVAPSVLLSFSHPNREACASAPQIDS